MYIFKETDNLYDWISTFIEGRLYFGPYPNQTMLNKLLAEGFNLFVDLTCKDDVEPTYQHHLDKEKYISYPIEDNGCPDDIISYCVFVSNLYKKICCGKRVYVNCRAGHSRSSMVIISLNCLRNVDINVSIDMVTDAHNNRKNLRDKWRKRRHPLHSVQFNFLIKIHRNLFINMDGGQFYNWLIVDNGVKKMLEEEKGNTYYILYNYFSDKFYKNKELNYRLQLTYLRKFILTDCNDVEFCRTYVDVLRSIRETILSA